MAPVTAAQSSLSNVVINLNKGGMLRVQINDPNNLLAATEKKTGAKLVVIGQAADGSSHWRPAIQLTSATGRNYNVLVPMDKAITL